MLTNKDLFSIAYYEKGAAFTGSQRDFRFRVEKVAPEDGENKLKLTLYPDELCYEKTPEKDREEAFFEFSQDGLDEIVQAINRRK